MAGMWAGAATAQDKFTLVIDPGHGGKQPGAVSGKLLEKDLNLTIAKKFGKLVEEGQRDVKVIYTRTGDTEIGLAARGEVANRNKADLFFSIHMNAHTNPIANGSSTWVMGMNKSEDNLREAMRENEVIKMEDDYTATYEGFDPSSAESYIIFQLMQYAHFDHSLAMARTVQKHYSANTTLRDRGAAQGPFVVLWKPAMPSVLTEVGFISNATDRAYISSAKGQEAIAKSLYDAFCEYRKILSEDGVVVVERAAAPKQIENPYYVQLFASRTKVRRVDAGVVERYVDGWYKYCWGPYESSQQAEKALAGARKKHKDAFVTR